MIRGYLRRQDRIARRDEQWRETYDFVRFVVDNLGKRCLSCGGSLWKRQTLTRRIYCNDRCARRSQRRRDRFRPFLREHREACPLCGCTP